MIEAMECSKGCLLYSLVSEFDKCVASVDSKLKEPDHYGYAPLEKSCRYGWDMDGVRTRKSELEDASE